MWTKESLEKLVRERLGEYLLIVASNRQPYSHLSVRGKIDCRRGAGGVITALDPVLKACGGTWVAYGDGDADRRATGRDGRLQVPADDPRYTLRRVWLTKEEEDEYYTATPMRRSGRSVTPSSTGPPSTRGIGIATSG